jgi:pimeloyl-ACP methyl ester carboxylesterase
MFIILFSLAVSVGCAGADRTATTKAVAAGNYHLHLPGISGYRNIDRRLMGGLAEGGIDGKIEHYDWTTADPGLGSLLATKRNKDEANNVAQILLEHYRADPGARITVTAHSGGAGIVVWALERLPDDVSLDCVVLLAPALSPGYDLTKALKHVRGKVYAFSSESDGVVLGVGTSLFGTIDGVKTEAAGKVGFRQPAGADAQEYKKLVQLPHQQNWIRQYGNSGEHIGAMNRTFAREVIAPLILTGKMPATQPEAAGAESEDAGPRERDSSTSAPARSR